MVANDFSAIFLSLRYILFSIFTGTCCSTNLAETRRKKNVYPLSQKLPLDELSLLLGFEGRPFFRCIPHRLAARLPRESAQVSAFYSAASVFLFHFETFLRRGTRFPRWSSGIDVQL